MSNTNQKNIFVCLTPLHVLISELVILNTNLDNNYLIYFYNTDNEKNRYYFNKLKNKTIKSYYIYKSKRHSFKSLFQLLFLILKISKIKGSKNFYFGNIKAFHSRALLLPVFNKIYTFDDGIANILGEGYFFEGESTLAKKIFPILKPEIIYPQILKKIENHYSIYKELNVMPNSKFFQLKYEKANSLGNKNGRTVNILLTSPLAEYDEIESEKEAVFYKKILEKFNINFIIPHPLEVKRKILNQDIKYITSSKIAEDIVIELTQIYDKVVVFGVVSSALVNLRGVENIELINLYTDFNRSRAEYDDIFTKFGILSHKIEI